LLVVDVLDVVVIVEFENDGPAWLGTAQPIAASATTVPKLAASK
jgi:hypothetical protein